MTTFTSTAPFPSYQRGIDLGRHYSEIADRARRGEISADEAKKIWGGMCQPKTFLRLLQKKLAKMQALPPIKYIENELWNGTREKHLCYLHVTWTWQGHRQVPQVNYMPWRGTKIAA